MKRAALCFLLAIASAALLATPASAKDKAIALSAAPAGVQATIARTTAAGATLEKVELEDEGGGTQYGAKITDKNGIRWEIIMDAQGKVLKTDQKKPKK